MSNFVKTLSRSYLKLGKVLPGLILCFGVMLLSILVAEWLGKWVNQLQGLPNASSSPISSIFVAIILGLLIRNFIGLGELYREGVTFAVKVVLKLGIILLGIRLSFIDVVKLGAWGIPIILACVAGGLFITLWITNKMNQSNRLGTLIACGTGICGVTAIVAVSPAIDANDEEVAYAIANITLFGVVAMFVYPYLANFLFSNDPVNAGLFLGTAIHETAQVAGAALIYDQVFDMPKVVDVATITKLTRNVLIIAVVPLLSYIYLNKLGRKEGEEHTNTKRWYQLIPLFVIGFMVMAIIRSIGDAGINNSGQAFNIFKSEQWITIWTSLNTIGSKYLLGIAMAGVGLSTSFHVFKGLGIRPLLIGLIAALAVGGISIIMVLFLGKFISF